MSSFVSKYLCFLNTNKNEKKLSNSAVNNFNKSTGSSHTTSDNSSDSTDSPKCSNDSLSSKDNTRANISDRRTFSTLGGKKSVKMENEIIYPSYVSTKRPNGLSTSASDLSLKELAEYEEGRTTESRSRSGSKNRRPSSRSNSSARSTSSGRSDRSRSGSRTRSESKFNSSGFIDGGKFGSAGMPFDNSQYKVFDAKKTSPRAYESDEDVINRRTLSKSLEITANESVKKATSPRSFSKSVDTAVSLKPNPLDESSAH